MTVANFGHNYAIGKLSGYALRMDSWGAGPFTIAHRNKSWRFEDSDQFGPALICKNGELRKNPYPDEFSPFWHVHHLWVKQGRRLGDDGETCVYDFEPEPG